MVREEREPPRQHSQQDGDEEEERVVATLAAGEGWRGREEELNDATE